MILYPKQPSSKWWFQLIFRNLSIYSNHLKRVQIKGWEKWQSVLTIKIAWQNHYFFFEWKEWTGKAIFNNFSSSNHLWMIEVYFFQQKTSDFILENVKELFQVDFICFAIWSEKKTFFLLTFFYSAVVVKLYRLKRLFISFYNHFPVNWLKINDPVGWVGRGPDVSICVSSNQ